MNKYIIKTYENGKQWNSYIAQSTLKGAETMMQNHIAALYEKYGETDMRRFEIQLVELQEEGEGMIIKHLTLI